jgi:hypothetical protein
MATRYVQGKDGKFKGSIGSGNTDIPTPMDSSVAKAQKTAISSDLTKTNEDYDETLQKFELALHKKFVKQYGEKAEWAYDFTKNTYPSFSQDKTECLTTHMAVGEKMGYSSPSALEPKYVDYDETEIDHYMQLEPHSKLEGVYVSRGRYLEAAYENLPEDTFFAVRLNDKDYDKLLVHGDKIVGDWADYDMEAYVVESEVYEDELGSSIESVDSSSTRIVRAPNGVPVAINTYLSAEKKPSEPDWDSYRDE